MNDKTEGQLPDLSALTERGAKAWAGVDAQGLREGATDMSKERDAFERALTELAARYDEAIQPSEFSRDDTGAYHNALTEISWMLWQAHTSLSANAGFTAADMATAAAQGFRDGAASIAANAGEPAAYLIDWPDEPELGHYFSESPTETGRCRPLYLAAPPTAQAEGWKLVPIEPTPAMLAAVVTSMDDFLLGKEAEKQYREDWAAMLTAAPPPPTSAEGVEHADQA